MVDERKLGPVSNNCGAFFFLKMNKNIITIYEIFKQNLQAKLYFYLKLKRFPINDMPEL